ncbi:hypothetical protein GGX14DRAFT_696473 [Mycena pura]|uniref:Uncharacterized protein n=1 Tax=Mycena pura TaxID=153505 RepID=A0AAD6VT37_9AGAR|nr:hypothetical protein GGX14DRAFT_696473 [Mycena pura]
MPVRAVIPHSTHVPGHRLDMMNPETVLSDMRNLSDELGLEDLSAFEAICIRNRGNGAAMSTRDGQMGTSKCWCGRKRLRACVVFPLVCQTHAQPLYRVDSESSIDTRNDSSPCLTRLVPFDRRGLAPHALVTVSPPQQLCQGIKFMDTNSQLLTTPELAVSHVYSIAPGDGIARACNVDRQFPMHVAHPRKITSQNKVIMIWFDVASAYNSMARLAVAHWQSSFRGHQHSAVSDSWDSIDRPPTTGLHWHTADNNLRSAGSFPHSGTAPRYWHHTMLSRVRLESTTDGSRIGIELRTTVQLYTTRMHMREPWQSPDTFRTPAVSSGILRLSSLQISSEDVHKIQDSDSDVGPSRRYRSFICANPGSEPRLRYIVFLNASVRQILLVDVTGSSDSLRAGLLNTP